MIFDHLTCKGFTLSWGILDTPCHVSFCIFVAHVDLDNKSANTDAGDHSGVIRGSGLSFFLFIIYIYTWILYNLHRPIYTELDPAYFSDESPACCAAGSTRDPTGLTIYDENDCVFSSKLKCH